MIHKKQTPERGELLQKTAERLLSSPLFFIPLLLFAAGAVARLTGLLANGLSYDVLSTLALNTAEELGLAPGSGARAAVAAASSAVFFLVDAAAIFGAARIFFAYVGGAEGKRFPAAGFAALKTKAAADAVLAVAHVGVLLAAVYSVIRSFYDDSLEIFLGTLSAEQAARNQSAACAVFTAAAVLVAAGFVLLSVSVFKCVARTEAAASGEAGELRIPLAPAIALLLAAPLFLIVCLLGGSGLSAAPAYGLYALSYTAAGIFLLALRHRAEKVQPARAKKRRGQPRRKV